MRCVCGGCCVSSEGTRAPRHVSDVLKVLGTKLTCAHTKKWCDGCCLVRCAESHTPLAPVFAHALSTSGAWSMAPGCEAYCPGGFAVVHPFFEWLLAVGPQLQHPLQTDDTVAKMIEVSAILRAS